MRQSSSVGRHTEEIEEVRDSFLYFMSGKHSAESDAISVVMSSLEISIFRLCASHNPDSMCN